MDYYSVSSEILDSWDFIRVPVRAPNCDPHREKTSIDDINPYVYYSRGVRKKLSRRIQPLGNRKRIESSTSLILTKTRNRQVLNEYFVSSFTNIKPHNPVHGDFYDKNPGADKKPLIKVTVIPQEQQTQTANAHSRKSNTKKLPSTANNPKNSFNTKNVFFVVAGRKKEKIYELNTSNITGENYLKKNVIRETFNANMNKYKRQFTPKKDKSARADELSETCIHECNCAEAQGRNTREPSPNKCKLKNKAAAQNKKQNATSEGSKNESNRAKTEINITKATTDVNAPKSRIRITGRLGLTGDDKYVLKCDATVDDKPIQTQFQSAQYSMLPVRMLAGNVRDRPPLSIQRDANIQADICYFPCPAFEKVSQGTQVYFDAERRTPKAVANYDKIVQCCCTNTAENSTYTSDDEDIALKKCKSPVVIISVYPKQESSDNITINKGATGENLRQQFLPQTVGNQKFKQKLKMGSKNEESNKKNKVAARSRSPSPLKSNNKEKGPAVKTNIYEKQVHDATTPSGSKKNKMKASKVQTIKQINTVTTKKIELNSKSQATSRSQSPNRRGSSPKPKLKATAGTNTERMLAKKALVDDFTKKYTQQLNENKTKEGSAFKTKHNVSNVTIHVEGDRDYYNVSFSQGDLDTDLTVRKNNKGNMTKFPGDDEHSTSLENFLFMQPENEPRKRSFSQTLMFDGTDPSTYKTNSKLNVRVRDSIEVSHRREDRASIFGKVTQTNSDKNAPKEVDTKFLAPIKHFQGDKCSITDPNERDMEIRKLLGIDRGRFKPPANKNVEAHNLYGFESDQVSVHCLYRDASQSEARKSGHKNNNSFIKNTMADWQCTSEKKTSLHPDLDINRHIEMLLQMGQLNKRKPIVLTRRQYAKVRKSIYNSLLTKNSMRRSSKLCTLKYSIVSIGQVRTKLKENWIYHYNKESQTDEIKVAYTVNQTQSYASTKHHRGLSRKFNDRAGLKLTNEILKHEKDRSLHGIVKATESITIRSVRKTIENEAGPSIPCCVTMSEKPYVSLTKEHQETMILFNASSHQKTCKTTSVKNEDPRKTASSLEVHNPSLTYMQQVKFSTSDIGRTSRSRSLKHSVSQNLEQKDSHSIHTIFKGHRKSLTPNLGTSAYSLGPEGDTDHSDVRFNGFKNPSNCDLKPRKPFLRRLISCLVMRASRASDTKFPPAVYRQPSVNSSIDSYYINTSLGAVEMTSSIYDTTASFYSNHTIQPITKMRRGFFSSVRGFLNRRS